MALKRRILDAGEGDVEAEFPPREGKRPTLFSVGREVMRLQLMQRMLVPILEPTLRRVVREEIQLAFLRLTPSVPRPPINQIQASGARGWYLHFNTTLPPTLFTGSVIMPIQIVLRNANSGEMIRSKAFSSIKVEIVVLDSDFGRDEEEDWSKEEFDAKIVSERQGKRPLLTGELVITLRDGKGYFKKVSFTDNSSWTKSRRFRLGVKVVQSSGEERIREATSSPFVVKDHRGELYKKHDSPSLGDKVWRLKNIGKDGAFRRRLADHGIETVEQFLRSWVIDANSLRNILGNGMSNKAWDETIQHARKCVLDNTLYKYYNPELQVGLVFNSIFEVVALTSDFQNFQTLDNLTSSQMVVVNNLKQLAYKSQESIAELDALPVIPSRPLTETQAPSDPGPSLTLQNFNLTMTQGTHSVDPGPSLALQNFNLTMSQEVPPALPVNFLHSTNPLHPQLIQDPSLPKNTEVMQDLQLAQPFIPVQDNSFNVDHLHGPHMNFGDKWSASGLAGTAAIDEDFLAWFIQQKENWCNGSFQVSGNEVGSGSSLNLSPLSNLGIHVSGNYKVNKGWRKLGAPLKWGVLARKRGVLARKHIASRRTEGFCS